MKKIFWRAPRGQANAPVLGSSRWSRVWRASVASALLASAVTVVDNAVKTASAATITTFSTGALTCPNGTTALLAEWAGLTSTPAIPTTSVTAPYAISLNTTKSGYPAGSVTANVTRTTISGSAGNGDIKFFTPTGAATQYNVPSLELGHDNGTGTDRYTVTITFPEPTRFYLPILDVDSGESGTVTAANGATAVLPTVTVRNPGDTTVSNSGTTASFANSNFNGNTPDNDDRGLLEISSAVPVTTVTIVDNTPAGSNEIGNIYGCQAQDIVKAGSTPTLVSTTATTATYSSTLTFKLGNTELAGNMRIYGPQITDSLSTIFGGSPTFSSLSVSGITASLAGSGGSTGCIANPSFNGSSNATLLTGVSTNYLAGGDVCTVTVNVLITYPASTTGFTKNNTATASGQGTNAGIPDVSTNGSTLPGTPKGDTASVTPLVFPPVTATVRIAKVSAGGTGTFNFSLTNVTPTTEAITTATAGASAPAAPAAHAVTAFGSAVVLTETTVAPNFLLSSVSCVDANAAITGNTSPFSLTVSSNAVTIPAGTVRPGSDITCTFTNDKLATLRIVKFVPTGQATPFDFLMSGVPASATGSPTVSTDPTYNLNPSVASGGGVTATQTYTNVAPGSIISASEIAEANINQYALVSISCVNAVGAPSGSTFVVSAINNSAANGSALGTSTVTLAPGADVTCTFSNVRNPKIVLVKNTVGGDGAFDFTQTVSGAGVTIDAPAPTLTTAGGAAFVNSTITGLSGAATTALTITETPNAAYNLTSISCVNLINSETLTGATTPSVTTNLATGQIVVSPLGTGAELACTYTNVKKPTLTVRKQSVGGTGTFTFGSGTNGLPAGAGSLSLDTAAANPASSTAYTLTADNTSTSITESIPAGWALTSIQCVDGSNTALTATTNLLTGALTLPAGSVAPGSQITCTFTNTNLPTIALNKALGAARSADSDEFTVEIRSGAANGPVVNVATNATTDGTGSTVTAGTGTTGTYTAAVGTSLFLTETGAGTTNLAYYSKTISCTDAAGLQTGLPAAGITFTDSLEIAPVAGAVISCTITNTVLPAQTNAVKSGVSVTGPSATGVYTANYTVTVTNTAPGATTYDLLDTPAFPAGLTVTGANWTTSGVGAPTGGSSATSGPYTLASAGTALTGFGSHTYSVAITFTFNTYTALPNCDGTPGTGLYNSVTMAGETGSGADNSACLNPPVPPVIDAVDDVFPTTSPGGTTGSVLVNDTLNTVPVDLPTITLAPGIPSNPGLVMNPDGTITVGSTVAPGVYTYPYTICAIFDPALCDTAVATVTVGSVINAVDNPYGDIAPGASLVSVLGNDTLNGASATTTNVLLTPGVSPAIGIVMNADGTITVAAAVVPGPYSYSYDICSVADPLVCDTAVATFTVLPVVDAMDDGFGTQAPGATTASVLGNDTLNSNSVDLTTVTLTPGTPSDAGLTMNSDGTISIAATTPPGTYTFPYEICSIVDPAVCDTATATVTVAAVVVALNDSYPGMVPGGSTGSVLANDTLNVNPADLTNVALTPGTPSDPGLTMNADGTITVAAGTPPGVYTYPYEICSTVDPTVCDTAVATVTVDPVVVAVDDPFGTVTGTTGSVLVNDTLNGNPVDITTVILAPGASPVTGVTMNADGTITVAANTVPGTYSYPYEICSVIDPTVCDTATATLTVAPVVDAIDDTYPTTPPGGTTGSVLGNDTLNTNPVDLTTVTLTPGVPSDPGLVMNPDGTITVGSTVAPGVYTYPYTICSLVDSAVCDTATATVTVGSVIDAVINVYGSTLPGGSLPSVLGNDTLNGNPATTANVTLTPGATPDAGVLMNADGTISIAATVMPGIYSYPYEICSVVDATVCDDTVATFTIGSVVDAVDNAFGSVTGTTSSVLGNDTLNLNPADLTNVTLTPGTPSNPGLTMGLDGTITVAANTAPGTYSYPYEICSIIDPTVCDSAVATLTVGSVIDAVDNTYTGVVPGGSTSSVLTNDTLNGNPATLTNVALVAGVPSNPGLTMGVDGSITVAANTPPGTYSYPYEICSVVDPTVCDTAVATVTVDPVVDATDDPFGTVTGTTGSVLVNDTLNGNPVDVTTVTLAPGVSPNPGLIMNADGTITIDPSTVPGTYSYPYEICSVVDPTVCDTAVATLIVAPVVDAIDDAFPPSSPGGTTGSVLGNDTLNTNPVDLTTVTLTPGVPSDAGLTMNLDGTITVGSTVAPGVYTYPYEICSVIDPAVCDSAVATVTVGSVINAIDNPFGDILPGGSLPSVLGNDTLNGVSATTTNVILTPGVSPVAGVLMNADGSITVAANTPPGFYSFPYTICSVVDPTVCDAAVATFTVLPVVDAVDNAFGAVTGTTASVLGNDTLNSNPADLTNVTLNPGVSPVAGLVMNADGTITIDPNTVPGTYTYPYEICSVVDPTVCDSAVATLTVASVVVANDDSFPTAPGGTTSTVLGNDTLNGNPTDLTNVTLTPGVPSNAGLVMNADGTITVAAGTPPGVYTYPYEICSIVDPTVCDDAVATVTIGSVIDAVDNAYGNVAPGAAAGVSVLDNDTLNSNPADLTNITLTAGVPSHPGLSMDVDGVVTVGSNVEPGSYTFPYTICSIVDPAVCDTAYATLTVTPVVVAVDDTMGLLPPGTTTETVLGNDTLNGNPATVGVGGNVTLTPGAPTNAGLTMNADGTITVAANTPPGVYTYPYTICSTVDPTVCDDAVATVTVQPVVVAVDDPFGAQAPGATTSSVLGNDTVNSNAADLTNITLAPGIPTNAGLSMNADGTITIAATTPPGNYSYPYEICSTIDATVCDDAVATVTVNSVVVAVDDDFSSVNSGGSTSSVLGNDTLNSNSADLTNVTLTPGVPSSPVLIMNADGTITVANNTPPGVYTFPYTICSIVGPTVCDDAVATVTVPSVVDAVDNDFGAVALNGTTSSVLGNDTLNGNPATLANVTLTPGVASDPGLTMNSDGTITVASNVAPGIYTYPYEICSIVDPAVCDTATATLSVGSVIDAVDNDFGANNPGATTPSIIGNDTLNDNPAVIDGNVTLTPGTAPATGVTMNADGTISIAANTPPGTYLYPYSICSTADATVCDTAVATIIVNSVIDAVDNSFGTVAPGDTTGSVIGNDTLNSNPAVVGTNVLLTPGVSPATGVTMNPDGTITVSVTAQPGTYSYPYTICSIVDPTVCDDAVATLTVPSLPVAVDDAYTVTVTGLTTDTVLVNDTLNSLPATLSNVTLTPGTSPLTGIAMNADGTITIDPNMPPGVYEYPYSICSIVDPSVCADAVATITIDAVIDAVDNDFGTVSIGTDTASVLGNDTLNNNPATTSNVALTPGTPTDVGLTMNADGTITIGANTTPGSHRYPYTICYAPVAPLTPAAFSAAAGEVCDTAVAILFVAPVITAVDNPYGVLIPGATTFSVFGNDALNGNPVVAGSNVTLTPGVPSHPGVVMNSDGTITLPANLPPGNYTYPYTICSTVDPTVCDDAVASWAIGSAVVAVNDTFPMPTPGVTASVLGNDTLNGNPVTMFTVTLTPGVSSTPGLMMNLDGTITVDPSTPAGTHTYTYTICSIVNPDVCSTATATITIPAVPPTTTTTIVTGRNIPTSGSQALEALRNASLFTAAGAGMVLVARRRRKSSQAR